MPYYHLLVFQSKLIFSQLSLRWLFQLHKAAINSSLFYTRCTFIFKLWSCLTLSKPPFLSGMCFSRLAPSNQQFSTCGPHRTESIYEFG